MTIFVRTVEFLPPQVRLVHNKEKEMVIIPFVNTSFYIQGQMENTIS